MLFWSWLMTRAMGIWLVTVTPWSRPQTSTNYMPSPSAWLIIMSARFARPHGLLWWLEGIPPAPVRTARVVGGVICTTMKWLSPITLPMLVTRPVWLPSGIWETMLPAVHRIVVFRRFFGTKEVASGRHPIIGRTISLMTSTSAMESMKNLRAMPLMCGFGNPWLLSKEIRKIHSFSSLRPTLLILLTKFPKNGRHLIGIP